MIYYQAAIIILDIAAGLVGAYFLAYRIAKRAWAENVVTQGKLIGFLGLYLTSFSAIETVLSMAQNGRNMVGAGFYFLFLALILASAYLIAYHGAKKFWKDAVLTQGKLMAFTGVFVLSLVVVGGLAFVSFFMVFGR
jgi:hypothetical protein